MFELPNFGAVQILGADASKVINNLCTNDISKLPVNECCEAFITNVRGWCVEHAFVLKLPDQIQLIGQFGNTPGLCAHIDRYIVREDAKVADQSGDKTAFLLSHQFASQCAAHFNSPSLLPARATVAPATIGSTDVLAVSLSLLSPADVILIAQASERGKLLDEFLSLGLELGTAAEFEQRRIASFWPKSGNEILEKSIPQELDRDETTISFTKGCYLGQETIARLDAIGQLQKKLCLIQIKSQTPIESGAVLLKDGQQVGQVTSAATSLANDHQLALAYLRRGNFAVGTQLTCNGAEAIVRKVEN